MGKFISLFAGVGGFDLGMELAGHECVAQVEWDKNAAGVLKRRWPDVPLFCDVSRVSGEDLPDCDFLTYGFPCQDLSVAGKREGLSGERSGLFFEATRLIRELHARGSGIRFALAENVAGLFSADDGRAFARCIGELLESGSSEIGWRVFDSQYFGVPQRRKRVFIVSDFGGRSCDEIFAITESLPGYPAPSRESGKGIAGDVEAGIGKGSERVTWPEVSMPCMSRDYKGPRNYQDGGLQNAVVQGADVYNGELTGEVACTLTSEGAGDPTRSGPKVIQGADVVGALAARDYKGVGNQFVDEGKIIAQGADVYNGQLTGEVAPTVTSATGISNASGPKAISWNGDVTPKASVDVASTLRAYAGALRYGMDTMITQQGGEGVGVAKENLTVRRLTPKECERLQGFPDEWTIERMELELVDNEWKPTGKVIKQTDGPRYKQMGNAVTVNVAYWLGKRMRKVIDE